MAQHTLNIGSDAQRDLVNGMIEILLTTLEQSGLSLMDGLAVVALMQVKLEKFILAPQPLIHAAPPGARVANPPGAPS